MPKSHFFPAKQIALLRGAALQRHEVAMREAHQSDRTQAAKRLRLSLTYQKAMPPD